MEEVDLRESRRRIRSLTYGVAAATIAAVVAAVPVQGTAWADSPTVESTSSTTVDAAPAAPDTATDADTGEQAQPDVGAEEPAESEVDTEGPADPDDPEEPAAPEPEDTEDVEEPGAVPGEAEGGGDPRPVQPDETEVVAVEPFSDDSDAEPDAEFSRDVVTTGPAERTGAAVATLTPAAQLLTIEVPDTEAPALAPAPVITTTTTIEAPPSAPKPLSPLAKLLQLPGRLINAFLQVFDLTSSASTPRSPLSLGPINDLLFAAFREFERLLGLDQPPAVQPAVPALTYDGPTTATTPTVAQFLNASAAGYVLGGAPADLVPFTVNGFQMSSTNIFSGMVAKTWVTPQGQIIIAYQGTTGGSNLLFNPLITVSQVLADLQVIFTRTTPWAFHDALYFAKRVQIRAAEQGYSSENIFVTGHSLGGWEAQYVAQQIGLAGIGFEAPGINTRVPGNGADAMFVNVGTYGSAAPYMSTDLPGLQPFMPPYVPGGGSKPHYGPIVMIGDPAAITPLRNASALWGKSLIGSVIFLVDFLGNFFQYHLPGVQAHHLDVVPDPGMVPWMGRPSGPVHTGWGALSIQGLMKAASDAGQLFRP
ncbi:hypothetical protein [Mycolicibacterium sp. D5.8-2]|uniref:hypothetical protein n=1 Tax=Mycolicibacterium sp. D5.8-2 TaxID=3085903 RepID=UPI00298C4DA8|nr:hypothetical protein [Mycolicibacterium sp. D5.8-2]MDW5612512.1 hypothetical protein [Mycolicibacterium sp. D5.8-2]